MSSSNGQGGLEEGVGDEGVSGKNWETERGSER